MNVKKWLEQLRDAEVKKPLPILSFPAVSLMGTTVKELINSSELQAKGMKTVAERLPAAASVSLMDLSVEAECFGAQIKFSDDEVPTVVGAVVTCEQEADELKVPEVGECRTGIYIGAIKKAVTEITDRPVFAGVIGPFSLAGRLLDVTEAMIYCYDEPDMVHTVLKKANEFLIKYILEYKKTGAAGVVIAEPLAGMLSPALAEEFSAPYVKEIVDAVQDDSFIVIYHNCGNNTVQMYESILSTGSAAYHFGNAIDIKAMLEKVPADIVVMGNIDPAGVIKGGTPETVRSAVTELLKRCSEHKNFVISTGCDVPPLAPWENIEAFFAAAHEYFLR